MESLSPGALFTTGESVEFRLKLDSVLRRCRRKLLALAEGLRYLFVRPSPQPFVIVSCERNAGDYALRCLESVFSQRYDHGLMKHIFIDDASDDGTHEKIQGWLATHSGHCVEYLHREIRRGGTANTLEGIRRAARDAVVVELNGDDWLADPGVLAFLGKVYADDDVWMTYNTCRTRNGPPADWARPYSSEVIANNAFRDEPGWQASHLHSFRKKLFEHLDPDTFIDPLTGAFWECADDQVLYLGMLELAGKHSRHLHRVSYIYNFWEASHSYQDGARSIATAARIRQMNRYAPLPGL